MAVALLSGIGPVRVLSAQEATPSPHETPHEIGASTDAGAADETAGLNETAAPADTAVAVETLAPDLALKSQWQATLVLHAYGCLSPARLAEALIEAKQAPPPADVTIHVIERVGNSVQIRLLRDHQELGQRDLLIVGETCPAVVEAAALLVTESLATLPTEPPAAPTVSEPVPEPTWDEPPPEPPSPTPPAAAGPGPWLLMGGLGVGTLYSPRFTPHIELLVGHRFGRPGSWGAEVRAGGLFGWGRVKRDLPEGAYIAAQTWNGEVLGCAMFPQVLGLCLGASVGVLGGQGRGFNEDFSSDVGWWTLLGQLESHLPLDAHWALHWMVRGQYSPEPPVFVVEMSDELDNLRLAVPRWALQLQAGARYWF